MRKAKQAYNKAKNKLWRGWRLIKTSMSNSWSRIRPIIARIDGITFFTAVLAFVAYLQWYALERTDETQRLIQRAFVFPQKILFEASKEESDKIIFHLFPIWENSGSSQTVSLRLFPYCGPSDIDVSPPFEREYTNHSGAVRRVLGPKQTAAGGQCNVSSGDIQRIRSGSFLYVGGQAIYNDIFGFFHRTQFCFEYLKMEDIALLPKADAEEMFGIPILCWRHNCADEECTREEKRPYN